MNTKLRVFVVSFTGNSGLTDYSVMLCRELHKLCDVTFITADSFDPQKYGVDIKHLAVFRRTRHFPIDLFKFIWLVLRQKPDIVLFQSWLKYPIIESFVVRIFRLFGIKTALTIHDLLPHYPRPWSKTELRWYYRGFDRLIVHSDRASQGLSKMGISVQPLMVPHGVYEIFNIHKLSRSDAQAFFAPVRPTDFVVLFFGFVETRKGIFEFLKASQKLSDDQSIKFLIAGKNTLKPDDRLDFDRYRSNANLVIHDESIPFEHVQRYFALADAVVTPYLEGTTSGILKLAMAFNKPIISTDIGDFKETLEDWPGILIDSSSDSIANGLAAGIQNMRDQYQAFIGDNKIKNATKYQWPHITTQYFQYLQSS